jgi:hypothetical protein
MQRRCEMKKVMLASLILVLLGALIMPAIAVSAPVAAWSGKVTCDQTALHFRVYVGVPTYLWGFIPLEDGQVLTFTHDGAMWETAGWTEADGASWLTASDSVTGLNYGTVGICQPNGYVTMRVNTDGLTAGTYTDTATFTFTTCATKTIAIPVTVDVIEPMVLGPLCIGVDEDLFKNLMNEDTFAAENNYSGIIAQLLTNPDDVMDMQAIEITDTSWSMLLKGGTVTETGAININTDGSVLTIDDVASPINFGIIMNLGDLISGMGMSMGGIPADFDWGNNYASMFATADGKSYIGIVIADINALMPLVSQLGSLLNPPDTTEPDTDTPPVDDGVTPTPEAPPVTEDLMIPLKPIMNMLPTLMPVLSDLLGNETVMAILSPLLDALPPIAVVLPLGVMMQLSAGLAQ